MRCNTTAILRPDAQELEPAPMAQRRPSPPTPSTPRRQSHRPRSLPSIRPNQHNPSWLFSSSLFVEPLPMDSKTRMESSRPRLPHVRVEFAECCRRVRYCTEVSVTLCTSHASSCFCTVTALPPAHRTPQKPEMPPRAIFGSVTVNAPTETSILPPVWITVPTRCIGILLPGIKVMPAASETRCKNSGDGSRPRMERYGGNFALADR